MKHRLRYALLAFFLIFLFPAVASAATCSWTTVSNGTTADADQLMGDLNCLAPLNNPAFTGSVGIGTATPSTVLELGPPSGHALLSITRPSTSFDSAVLFKTAGGVLDWDIATDPAFGSAGDLTFYSGISGASVLLQKSTGYVGIRTTSPGYALQVNGSVAGVGAYVNTSDARLKFKISSWNEDALDHVMRLRPVSFYWKSPTDDAMRGQQIGFVAQEVEQILPTAVTTERNAQHTKGIKYNELISVLTKAVQEQEREVRAMRVALARQDQEIRYLRKQITPRSTKLAQR